jgi:UDP-glucose 4-epimerase
VTVLVLGGCGFIGSHVVDALLAAGQPVRVLDRQPEQFRAPLPGVEYQFGQFGDRAEVTRALRGVDRVVHLISTTVPGTADLDPRADVLDNVVGTLSLLETMMTLGIGRILFLSSGGTVYGVPQEVPIPEWHCLAPVNAYGIGKVAIESYMSLFERTRGLSPVVLRASNPYGPRQGKAGVQGIVGTCLRRLIEDRPLEIWGDGSIVRDFFSVRDLAALCVTALLSDRTGPYNAGSGLGVSVNEVVGLVSRIAGRPVKITYQEARPQDVPRSILDVSRAHADFGWTASVTLEVGVAETWDWMRSVARTA